MRHFISAATLALVITPAFGVDIAVNGGFEIGGDTPDSSASWIAFGSGAPGTQSVRSGAAPFAGSFAHSFTAFGADALGAAAGANQHSQPLGFVSLAPGSTLSMSFMGSYTFGPGGVGFYEVQVLNSVGAIVATSGLQVINANTAGYQAFTSPNVVVPAFGAAPNDAYYSFIGFSVAAGAFNGSSAQGTIDSVAIEATLVPAPAAPALLGAGLLLVTRRRRA